MQMSCGKMLALETRELHKAPHRHMVTQGHSQWKFCGGQMLDFVGAQHGDTCIGFQETPFGLIDALWHAANITSSGSPDASDTLEGSSSACIASTTVSAEAAAVCATSF
jgi:hypothetical protein